MALGRPQKYPWVNWLDGERYVLNSVENFPDVDVRSFRQQALNEAARRGVTIRTQIAVDPRGDGIDYIEITRPKPVKSKRLDWDEILGDLPRTFVHGSDDFTCSIESMRVRIHQAAQRRAIPVRIERQGDRISVYPVREEPVTEMAPAEEAERDG